MTPKDKHHPREYRSSSWPYWRRSSAYCGWNLSGAWYAYQLWERAVHHQKRAAVSKNFGPMGTQIVEWSTNNCSCSNFWNTVGALRRGRGDIHSSHSHLWWNLGVSLHTRDEEGQEGVRCKCEECPVKAKRGCQPAKWWQRFFGTLKGSCS